jgi:nucleoside 2-deoxyribosyltransferase
MQFGEPFDSLYNEVIKQVALDMGFEPFRADDVFRPGVIIQDIIRSIVASDVIIAEVTPENPNVFFELGYAHAIDKPTVLLAERPTESSKPLPFDIRGFRVIFYDDTIRGKREVESMLRQHLTNIREGRLDSLP